MKKYAYINEDDNKFWNVVFLNSNEEKSLRTDIFIREVTSEDLIKYDLLNQPTITYGYDEPA
jgi:hypothetical protein